MARFEVREGCLRWTHEGQLLELRALAPGAIRVRATRGAGFAAVPNALVSEAPLPAEVSIRGKEAVIGTGGLEARLSEHGRIRFFGRGSDDPLVEEVDWDPVHTQLLPNGREFAARDGDLFRIEQRFAARDGERFFGLGQHRHGLFDQKGAVIELVQRNAEVCIPLLVSSRRYGLLWNHPGTGRVELGTNRTCWVADAARQIDYVVVTAEDYAGIMAVYADLTGHAPELPSWATGFWQCKLRYRTQEELLGVAREYHRRGLPLAVVVVDFFHWTKQGEWQWDPVAWPDPALMARELDALGVKLMVSVWPTVNPRASTAQEMRERGLLVGTDRGVNVLFPFVDTGEQGVVHVHYYDPFNPEARAFLWDRVKASYLDRGVALFWLDACEPEIRPLDHANLRFHEGPGAELACLYPFRHQQAFFEGMRAAGRSEVLNLCRSAWAGSQRFGAAVWSGDIHSTWEMLRASIRAGLNMMMSGIPWWTTDIGGFMGGDGRDPGFRELLVRWFQWGVFCPLFRLHGYRQPAQPGTGSGGDNEPWSFGEEAYRIIREQLLLRERLRSYLGKQARLVTERGTPPMRPLFFDYPEEETAWTVDDELLFGPDIVAAPVVTSGARSREVWLPRGARWRDAWTGKPAPSAERFVAEAPLDRIPVYLREGAQVRLAEVGP